MNKYKYIYTEVKVYKHRFVYYVDINYDVMLRKKEAFFFYISEISTQTSTRTYMRAPLWLRVLPLMARCQK